MEDLKQIQEFFLNENVFVEAFKFEKALKGMGYNVKVKYLDDFGKDIFEIYFNNPADADDDSIFYDAKKLGYDNIRVFANPQESIDEAYIVTYAKNKGEKPASAAYKLKGSALAFMRDLEKDGYTTMLTQRPVDGVDESIDEYNSGIYYTPDTKEKTKDAAKTGIEKVKDMIKKITTEADLNDPVAMKMRAAKMKADKLAKMRAANAGDDGNDKFFEKSTAKLRKLKALKDKRAQIMRDMEQEAEIEGGAVADKYGDMLNKLDKAISMLGSQLEEVKKGHGEKVSKEVFAKLKGKTISYKGEDYKVADVDDATLKLQDEKGKYKTINFNQFNIDGLIREIMETIELGKQLEEGKLCPKGEAYRKRRMAAGEKSSAYLSGRAVKVCKGQMSGKKKK
jgi:hypothetical protein